ncbi:SMP-30/gluconolactonase/LRE family protein [Methylocapsa sp. S129]|uniref:SMP-30/gluconolactonase/LRE family protein n=1 Tax=Methylocapsa sp. S129 TaxID=1641869 RepID=UPI00131C9E0C|nr:SMP-30/gluconolactonase/LRE family protein [Methylocapsa sp. S129]
MRLEGREITSGLGFPEGPIALADGSVLVVEIEGGRLTRVQPSGRRETVAELGGGPNGAAMGPDGKCYVCNNGGFAWQREETGYLRPIGRSTDYQTGRIEQVDLATGAVKVLYDQCNGVPLKGPNDIVFDAAGGFWFTDLGKTYGRVSDRGAVYYARTDGSLIKEAIFPILTPNGVGLSPDGRTLYVSETETSRLWRFDIIGVGEVAKEPWPSPNGGKLVHGLPGYQRFDSLAVEANGAICVATLVRGGVSVFSPEGDLLEFHEAPEPYCTNICFGGPLMKTAYITLSGTGRLIAVDWPRAGLALRG